LDEPHPHRRYRWSDQTRSSSILAGAAAAVWVAGIWLSRMTDVLALRFHLGEASRSHPARRHDEPPRDRDHRDRGDRAQHRDCDREHPGGIAIQTVALAVINAIGLGTRSALTYLAASLQLVLEGAIVIAVLGATIMGTQFGAHVYFGRVEPAALNSR
jgi:cation:H+ antiporter